MKSPFVVSSLKMGPIGCPETSAGRSRSQYSEELEPAAVFTDGNEIGVYVIILKMKVTCRGLVGETWCCDSILAGLAGTVMEMAVNIFAL